MNYGQQKNYESFCIRIKSYRITFTYILLERAVIAETCFLELHLLPISCVRKRNVKKSYLFFPPSLPWPLVHDPVEYINVCQPSPCGINAVCREQNGVGSCTCIEDHLGNPYEGCHPECVLNSDCPSNKACVRNKCQDPCPGVCGQNALCNVVNHLPQCNCLPGYTGDPFRFCSVIRDERKNFEL